jgi:hypothetical protein
MAELVPDTVRRPVRGPQATLLATIRATFGPGIRITRVTVAMKARRRCGSIIGLSEGRRGRRGP